MIPKNIPDDINAEVLLEYLPKGTCKTVFRGLHKRNVYNDLIDIEELHDKVLLLTLGRSGLYDTLPELMFHPIDRFDNLPKQNEKEQFEKEYETQEHEKEQARRFFEPVDLMLLHLRLDVREKINAYVESNKALIDVLGDEIPNEQLQNRFVRQTIPFLPSCKYIRGNKTLLTLMLRKVFVHEGISIKKHNELIEFADQEPKYDNCVGGHLETLYVGNLYYSQSTTYDIHFWPDDSKEENLLNLVEEVEIYRCFIQDYFMAIDDILRFDISTDNPVCLADGENYHYLNYNTNL